MLSIRCKYYRTSIYLSIQLFFFSFLSSSVFLMGTNPFKYFCTSVFTIKIIVIKYYRISYLKFNVIFYWLVHYIICFLSFTMYASNIPIVITFICWTPWTLHACVYWSTNYARTFNIDICMLHWLILDIVLHDEIIWETHLICIIITLELLLYVLVLWSFSAFLSNLIWFYCLIYQFYNYFASCKMYELYLIPSY